MSGIEILAGPAIGAVIGYCTNYIAVKMLFRPLKPLKIGGKTLPFTPGIIPRGQERMARAMGQAVGEHLLSKEELEKMLLSEEVRKTVVSGLTEKLLELYGCESSLENFLCGYMERDQYEHLREGLEDSLTGKITDGLANMNVAELIATEGSRVVKDKFQGTMVSMFLSDNLIASIAGPLGKEVEAYIQEHGEEKIRPLIKEEIAAAESLSVGSWMEKIPADQEKIMKLIDQMYVDFVSKNAGELAEKFHVAQIVEEKIKDMDVLELEHLLLGIMKKELNAVVNLGALIGFLLGLLNIWF